MGRGVSSGGGQSSLNYLFGSGEAPNQAATNAQPAASEGQAVNNEPSFKTTTAPQLIDVTKQIPAGINSNTANKYFRADGKNSGTFITVMLKHCLHCPKADLQPMFVHQMNLDPLASMDRPSTKVQAAPGGGSSLDYLFGGGSN